MRILLLLLLLAVSIGVDGQDDTSPVDYALVDEDVDTNATLLVPEQAPEGSLFIQRTFEAVTLYGVNITTLPACVEWQDRWMWQQAMKLVRCFSNTALSNMCLG